MDETQKYNIGTGITYAVRHLRTSFIASGFIWPSTWKADAGGDEHERRRADVEAKLRANNSYLIIGAGNVIAGEALGYIYRTDNLMDKLVRPAKQSHGSGWGETRSLITKFLDNMESDLSRMNPTLDQVVPAKSDTPWVWDAGRELYYRYDSRDRMFKYHNDMWVRLDGSQTSYEQEVQLAQAYNVSAQPLLGYENSLLSVTASMRQITMGQGEDAALK